MTKQLLPIHFHTEGFTEYGDLVPLNVVADALRDFAEALESITKHIARVDDAVAWILQDAQTASFAMDVLPQPQVSEGERIAEETVRLYILASEIAVKHGKVEELVPRRAARAIERTVERVDKGEMGATSVRRGDQFIEFRPSMEALTRKKRFQSFGSIEGYLNGVSFSGTPYFTVKTSLDGVAIRCFFDANRLYDDVVHNLRRRVAVSGWITKSEDGVPRSVSQIERIYAFPPASTLPQASDLEGLDPDLTEGMASEEWIDLYRV